MAQRTPLPPRLLVIDDDRDIRFFLQDLLTEEGYDVDVVATLDEALMLLDSHVYHLVLTDLLTHSSSDPLRSAITVRDYAYPTPVVALTGWSISSAEVTRAGLARLIAKPFDLSDLLTSIKVCLVTSFNAAQQRQAETLRHYCRAFAVRDLDACMSLCTEDVHCHLSAMALGEPEDMAVGRAAFRQVLERRLRLSPGMSIVDYRIHPQAEGLAMRCLASWEEPHIPNDRVTAAASMVFHFDGDHISQINLRLEGQRWHALLPEAIYTPSAHDSQR